MTQDGSSRPNVVAIGGGHGLAVTLRAAREYARHAEVPWDRVRFDVVNVVFTKPPAVTHFRDVLGLRRRE